MDMIAKKEFRYNGRALKVGQRFDASARAARIFGGVGKAEAAPSRQVRQPRKASASQAGADDLLEQQSESGRYSRSDMRAAD